MRSVAGFVLLGVLVFLMVAIAVLPVTVLTDRLPAAVQCEGAEGTLLGGSIERVVLHGTPLASVRWEVVPAALLKGEFAYQVSATRSDGTIAGRVGVTLTGVLAVDAMQIDWPIDALKAPGSLPGWGGQLTGRLDTVRIAHRWPTRLLGTLAIAHLHAPNSDLDQGTYEFHFSPATNPEVVHAEIKDLSGPLALVATLALGADRSYELKGALTPRPGTPETLKDSFTMLGPPDAEGRREFDMAGSL